MFMQWYYTPKKADWQKLKVLQHSVLAMICSKQEFSHIGGKNINRCNPLEAQFGIIS